TYMMTQVVERGTGRRAQIDGWQIAGKTGTTQGLRDAWFIGFTSEYVAGVWMGYDDNSPMSNVTGGSIPADIWSAVMTGVHDGIEPTPLPIVLPAPRQEEVVQRDQTIEDAINRELNKVEDQIEDAVNNLFDRLFGRN
ncbi:MAG: penicillin-binding transpeptidase domain-containing protein, partial [Pseudomonadota bacterium]